MLVALPQRLEVFDNALDRNDLKEVEVSCIGFFEDDLAATLNGC